MLPEPELTTLLLKYIEQLPPCQHLLLKDSNLSKKKTVN